MSAGRATVHRALFLALLAAPAAAQQSTPSSPPSSVAVVAGVFAMIFSLTFFILLYAKFCRPSSAHLFPSPERDFDDAFGFLGPEPRAGARAAAGDSSTGGVSQATIQALPFFRFASLRGARDGLECAVCLSRFLDADLLRLLPRCRHAFHLECVDRWLEDRATCPLCRCAVTAADARALKFSSSARFLFNAADDDGGKSVGSDFVQLFVERESNGAAAPTRRFNLGESFRRIIAGERRLPAAPAKNDSPLHKHKHKVVVALNSRWSDINSADLAALHSEMLRDASSLRFEPPAVLPETTDAAGSSSVSATAAAARSMSEIAHFPRFKEMASGAEENVRKVWLPIARRTVQCFAVGERRPATASPAAVESRGDREADVV